jgi:Holliday junction resolvasome RuvABC endonuclease subunit
MRILSLDVGSKRMGWAVLDFSDVQFGDQRNIRYVASGVLGLDQEPDQKFNDYRLQIIDYWVSVGQNLLDLHQPYIVVNEIMPMVDPQRGRAAATQSVLAISAITAFQTICVLNKIPVHQIAAVTVKKRITGNAKATKVQVRNGLFEMVPILEALKKPTWKGSTRWEDESDAVAVGVAYLK